MRLAWESPIQVSFRNNLPRLPAGRQALILRSRSGLSLVLLFKKSVVF
jgi:hypothetical protein